MQVFTPELNYIAARALRERFGDSLFFAIGRAQPWENEVLPPDPSTEVLDPFLYFPATKLSFAMRASQGLRGAGRSRTGLEGLDWQIVDADVEFENESTNYFTNISVPLTHLAVEATLLARNWEGSFRTCCLLADTQLFDFADGRPAFGPNFIEKRGTVLWMSTFQAITHDSERNHRFRVFL